MISARVTTDSIRALRDLWAQAPDVAREEMLRTISEADDLLKREVTELTPVGVGGGGGLKGSIFSSEQVLSDNVIGIVGTSQPYAVPVELGTKPHFPPVAPLIDWVQAKLGVSAEEAPGVAFLVARKISVHGTDGQFMFKKAFDANEAQIEAMFGDAVIRITERLS